MDFVGATWSVFGMDVSEVTLRVDTYGLGFRGAQSWGDTPQCTLWALPEIGYVVSGHLWAEFQGFVVLGSHLWDVLWDVYEWKSLR